MTDLYDAAGAAPAAASTTLRAGAAPARLGRGSRQRACRARPADRSGAHHRRRRASCSAASRAGRTAFEHLSWRALVGLAKNEPVDPERPRCVAHG